MCVSLYVNATFSAVHTDRCRWLQEQTSACTPCEVHSQKPLEKWDLPVSCVCNNLSPFITHPCLVSLELILPRDSEHSWHSKFNNHPPHKEIGSLQGWKTARRGNRLLIFALCHSPGKSTSSFLSDCALKVQASLLLEIIFSPQCE